MTALYRKYRPRTFDEVIGQDHVTQPLIQALKNGRLNHAYLFSGPRGCGKTSSARILARSLNCAQGPTPYPCGECESCVALAPDGPGSIDVIEIDAASHGGVDDARELREKAFFAPVSSRYKVYVIDEAHMVSTQGFNALLKLVEEPPDYVRFVFATTEPEKVLGTIKSRTHHYPFRLIPPSVLRPYCEQLCAAEGAVVEPAVLPLVVRAGGGSARDTLSILDQLIAGAGPDGVTYARAVALLGVTDAALIDEMCDALGAGDGAAVFGVVDRVVEAGHDPRRFASDLLERLRDLIVLHQVPDAATKGLLDVPPDEVERMTAQARRLGPAELSRLADLVHDGLIDMRGTTAPRLVLELICARMLLPGADDSGNAFLQRLERLERRFAGGSPGDAEVPAPLPGGPTGREAARAAAARSAQAAVSRTAEGPAAASRPAPEGPTTASRPAPEGPAAVSRAADAPAPVRPAAPAAPSASPSDDGWPSTVAPGSGGSTPTTAGPATDRGGATARPDAPQPATPAAPTPAGTGGGLDAAAVRRAWDDVLAQVRRSSRKLAGILVDGTVREVDGDTLVLVFKGQWHAAAIQDASETVSDAIQEVLGVRWKLRCDLGGPGTPAGRTPAPRQPGQPRQATGSTRAARANPGSPGADGWPDTPPPDDGGEPAAGSRYEGFDPGDEPVDEPVNPDGARQSSEEQALKLLADTLGAEKIRDL